MTRKKDFIDEAYLDPDPSGKWEKFLRFSPIWVILFALLAVGSFVASGIMYVPPKKMAILIRKAGKNLKSGQILAMDSETKGIQVNPISEGLHWYNPYVWDWNIRNQVSVPKGKVGVQIRLYGKSLKSWQVIAKDGEKGLMAEVLKAGRYLLNPYAIKLVLKDAVTVPTGHRGVVWNISGKIPGNSHKFLVEENERGVQISTLEAGTYYYNPFAKRIIPVNMRSHRFDTNKNDPIRFPSKDGFTISMDVMIEWAIDPNRLAEVYVKYVDRRGIKNGKFYKQKFRTVGRQNYRYKGRFGRDYRNPYGKSSSTYPVQSPQKSVNTPSSPDVIACIVEKVILPNVRSFTRLEGSNYPAIDFIQGERRILFQNKFGKELVETCGREGILIHSALVRDVSPPDQIAKPIRDREIAIRNAEKYKKEMEREEQEKELAMEKELQEQKQRVTQTNASQDVARVDSIKKQQVALTLAKQQLAVAKRNFEAAKDQASAKIISAKAKAYVIYKKNKAEAAGLKEAADSFGGGQDYVMYLFNQKIAPSMSYVLSNTDGPFMRIFETVLQKDKKKDFVPKESKVKKLKFQESKKVLKK